MRWQLECFQEHSYNNCMTSGETVNVFNEAGEVVATLAREEAERNNHATESVLIFVFDSSGQVLVQLRSRTKKYYPGRWDISAAGGVMSHESHQEAAHRETNEETGIDLELQYVQSFMHTFPDGNGKEQRRLSHLYIGMSDDQPMLNDEVEGFKKWDPSELRQHALAHQSEYVAPFVTELDMALKAWQHPNYETTLI